MAIVLAAMPNLQTITDAPTVLLAVGEAKTSRVQVAKLGENFNDPRYGKFKITQAHFDKWQENHAKLFGQEGAPIDLDHSPETLGQTKAVGWIKGLEQQGTELWSTVEWTDEGAGHVESKAYKFVSPSYAEHYFDEERVDHGTTLKGAALTNRPFLRMAAVNLSRSPVDAYAPGVEEDRVLHLEPAGDSPARMGLIEDLRSLHQLPEDASESQVLAAATAAADKAKNTVVTPPDAKTLSQMAQAEGFILMNAADHASLTTSAVAGAAAAKQLHEARFEGAYEKALSDPKGARVLPAQKDGLLAMYEKAPDETIALMDGMPHLVPGDATGHTGAGTVVDRQLAADADGHPIDEDRQALHERTLAICTEKNIDYGAALTLASAELGS